MAISPPPRPALSRGTIRPLWSQTVPNRPVGLVLARERAWLFVWDKHSWLYLFGSADFGLVACYGLDGQQRWRDGLVQSSGALTVSGDGATILLACYTEGLQRYSLEGKNCGRVTTPEPCYLASMSFDGRLI